LMPVGIIAAASETVGEVVWVEILNCPVRRTH